MLFWFLFFLLLCSSLSTYLFFFFSFFFFFSSFFFFRFEYHPSSDQNNFTQTQKKGSLGTGVSEASALKDLHPEGFEYYKMCTSLKRAVRALSRDDPVTGEALSVPLVTVQLGSGSMAMKSQAAHDAATALREISPLDPRGGRGRGGGGGGELLPEAAERLRGALRAPLPQRGQGGAAPAPSPSAPPPASASAASLPITPWFLIETKIDGYRLQLHKDTTPGGFQVKFFSPR